jgi:outer membrane receptor protein involved in Fe transport
MRWNFFKSVPWCTGLLVPFVLLSWQMPAFADDDAATPSETVTVTAQRLNVARTGIENQTGASTYTISESAIAATPGGDNTLLNQVTLQAPDVAQDSFGQFHVRGEHNGLQYRLNGIILPEGISVFGQTLSPRLISSLKLITGALPAEYGLRTAGIIDVDTKSGLFEPGGEVSLYGGSHGTIEPSFEYGGSSGSFNYFVSGDFLQSNLGIESPDGSPTPLHDKTDQYHGFGYFEDILDKWSKVSVVLGTSHDQFQIPNTPGVDPDLGLTVNGQTTFPSAKINENQREITHFGVISYLHSQGQWDFQVSAVARYSSLSFTPDPLADLLFNGIAQQAYKRDVAYGVQGDSAYHLNGEHTIRAGFYVQTDRATSTTNSQALPVNCAGSGTSADPYSCSPLPSSNPAYDVPIAIADNGTKRAWLYSLYLQDEWQPWQQLTINYGLRFDSYSAFSKGSQLSPRANVVWQPLDDTTIHAGYSRYFSPPPFELVGSESVSKFINTTASPAITVNDTPSAERANYYDIGVQQVFLKALTVGVDAYYKTSHDLIDEGQFGAPIILTPFNYKKGKQYGIAFTANYFSGPFSAYGNLALSHAEGQDIVSSQFQFDPGDLAYIADHFIHLDHEQYATVSAGASYALWQDTQVSTDVLYGTGLRRDGAVPNGAHVPAYTQVNAGISHDFELGGAGSLTMRFDVINVFDEKYEIRDGTGVGVGAPQFGPRRGFFVGVSKSL